MSVVRILTPDNPLAEVIDPGGMTQAQLAALADARVATLRPQIIAEVGALRRRLLALASGPETEVFAHSRDLGHAALSICEIAAVGGLSALGDAARGVYAMIEALISQGVWHTEALLLHVEALRLLSAEPPPADAPRIIAGLRAMRLSLGAND